MNLSQYANGGNLSKQAGDELQNTYGINFGARGYEGGAIGNTGYEAYHTGTGWGVRQPGQQQTFAGQSPGLQAAPQPPQNTGQVLNQAPTGQPPTTVTGAYQNALFSKLAQGPVTADSPQLKGAMDANKLAEQRGFERDRALMAERAASQGLDQNAMNSGLMGLSQARSGREGQFAGNLVASEQGRQDQMLAQMLGLTGNMLSGNEGRELQRYGMDQDAQLRREGLGAQTGLGSRELDIRSQLGNGQLNLGLLGLLQNGEQFGQQLGANLGMFGANLNQNALLNILGGL